MKTASRSLTLALLSLLLVFVLLPATPALAAPPPPTVTNVNNSFGGTPGGTTVVVTGTALTGAGSVTFGGIAAAGFRVDSDTQIVASSPAHSEGKVDVVVTTASGSSSAAGVGNDFTYVPRVEQANFNFLYSGNWKAVSSPSSSGGSYRYASAMGDSVSIVFYGNHFTWLGKRGPDQGLAGVSIDGGSFFNIDLYNSIALYKLNNFSLNTSYGTHTITIKFTGLKNIASSGLNVNVDAFDIVGSLIPYSRIEQSNSSIVYAGAWSTLSSAGASGGGYKRSSATNAEVSIPFLGQRLDIYGMKGTTAGIVDVYVDGSETPWNTIDLSNATALYKQKLISITDPDMETHVVTLRPNPASPAGRFINLDYVEVIGSLLPAGRVEQTTSFFTWAGAWTKLTSSSYSGGSFAYTNTAGSFAAFAINGVRLDLIAKTGPNYGIAKVTLDGTKTFLVDLYSASTLYKRNVWSTGWLAPGVHTLKIEWTGTKRAAATKTNINVDAVLVTGPV